MGSSTTACLCVLLLAGLCSPTLAQPKLPGTAASGHIHVLESKGITLHPTLGPADAPVRIEFFFNLNNPRTRVSLELIRLLAKRHPTRLHVVFRLTEKREFSSNLAQTFGMEAWKQGRFFPFIDAFYEGRSRPPSTKEFEEVGNKAGIDYSRVRAAMNSSRYQDTLSKNHNHWRRMAVRQLPGLVLNGHPTPIPNSLDALEAIYDQAYEQSIALLARGVPKQSLYSTHREQSLRDSVERAGSLQGHVGSLDLAPDEDLPLGPLPVSMGQLLQGKHRKGPDSAPVKAVFLCHLRSSMCRTMFGYLDDLGRLYPNEFQLIYLPLYFSDRPGQDNAHEMYEAVLCADEQKAYWEYLTLVYQQRIRVNFDNTHAIEIANSLQLDGDRFQSCLESGRQKPRLASELALAKASGARHTPSLAIGGLLYSGRLYANQLRNIVESMRAPGFLDYISQP